MKTDRRTFLAILAGVASGALTGATARFASAFGAPSVFSVGLLRYDSPSWNPRPDALSRLLLEVELTTSIMIDQRTREVRATTEDLATTPLVWVAGDQGFSPWSSAERDALARFIAAGGTLVFDSSEGRADGAFREAVERELAAILPRQPLTRLPREHVVYKAFYLCDGSEGRVTVERGLDAITVDQRAAVLYAHNDLLGAYARDGAGNHRFVPQPGGERQRQMTFRLGVNIVMYALCLDYKEDQVHVPFIMRRRRWRVD